MKHLSLFCAVAISSLFVLPSPVRGADIEPKAEEILKKFCDKISEVKGFGYTAFRIVDPEIAAALGVQKSARIDIAVNRPNQLSMSSHGNLGTMHLVYDGTNVSFYDELMNMYSQAAAGPTIDSLVELMEETFGVAPPLFELAVSDPYKAFMDGVHEGRYVGVETVRGIECDHLVFATTDNSWDIWIDREKGIPQKAEIVYKWTNGTTPKVRIEFIGWGKSAAMAEKGYAFEPPRGAKQVPLELIQDIEAERYKAQVKRRTN